MDCTQSYREHIMYSFNGFCKVVIRYAAINAWRDRNRRRQKEISFEYLTEEKFTPNTFDEALQIHPTTIPRTNPCGQTIDIPTASDCLSPVIFAKRKEGNHLPLLFRNYTQQEIGFLRAL